MRILSSAVQSAISLELNVGWTMDLKPGSEFSRCLDIYAKNFNMDLKGTLERLYLERVPKNLPRRVQPI